MIIRHERCGARRGVALALVVAAASSATGASAQDAGGYPARPIQLIVPFTPGTGADILSRVLGPKLAERWKVGVITDNRAGATGAIGADYVARQPPDGYTLLFTATAFSTTPAFPPKPPFDPIRSFSPVILLATGALGVVVNSGTPARSMREFIDLVKREPGKLNYSSPGTGGPQHLAMELLKLETGIDIVHVPYKSAAPALSALVAGQVQAMISALQTAAPLVKSGKLRMLGVMSAERRPAFPDVPTLREQGLAGVEVETWYGVFAPAGTPAPIVSKLNAEIDGLLRQPDVREVLAKQGLDAEGGTPERFAQMVATEIPRWTRVVNAAGIKPE